VSNPAAPAELAAVDTNGRSIDLQLVGDLLYVADDGSGLVLYDVSNPLLPVFAGGSTTPGLATGVAVVGDFAYVADWAPLSGIRVFDVSQPSLSMPALEVGAETSPENAYDVVVAEGLVYVADGIGGLRILDFGPQYAQGAAVPTFGGGARVWVLLAVVFVATAVLRSPIQT
jgi:hypothetical protein